VSEIPEYPSFQVLGKDGAVMIASVSGAANPVAVIDDTLLGALVVQCRRAKEEAMANPGDAEVGAVMELCATLSGFLDQYSKLRNTYYGGAGLEVERDAAIRSLEATVKELDKFPR